MRRQGTKKAPKRYRIRLDSDACIGCLACTRCEGIEAGEDMKAHALIAEVSDSACYREMAKACPVRAIAINVLPNAGLRAQPKSTKPECRISNKEFRMMK